MSRIFLWMAIGQLVVLLGSGVLAAVDRDQPPDRHVLAAVFSLLLSCLIQVVLFTYLTVTGKMIAQAVHLGHLDRAPLTDVRCHKRLVTYLMGAVVGTLVLATATGAHLWGTEQGASLHTMAASLAVIVHAFALYRESRVITANAALFEQTLDLYKERRKAASEIRGAGGQQRPDLADGAAGMRGQQD